MQAWFNLSDRARYFGCGRRENTIVKLFMIIFILCVPCTLVSACARPQVSPSQQEEAQKKFMEYELARAVVARSETCFETLLPELRAMAEGGEGAESPEEFAARWGLDRFDPNTGFDDAWAACVGAPSLKDLGIGAQETPLRFLERKRGDWEQAERAATGRASSM